MIDLRGRHKTTGLACALFVAGCLPGYAQAVQEPSKSSQEALLLYGDAANFQNNGAFELAAEEWEKFLKKFPEDHLAAQAQHHLGTCQLQLKRYDKAAAAFQTLIAKHPRFDSIQEAYLNLGWAQLKADRFADAGATLTTLIDNYPDHTLLPDGRLARAMCRRQGGEFAGALEDLDAYLATNPALNDRCDALYERGLTQVALKKFSEATATFSELLKADEQYPQADRVLYELAWATKSLEGAAAQSTAMAHFARLAASYPDSPLAAEANFHVGEMHYQKQEFAEAAQAFAAAKPQAKSDELREKTLYKLGWCQFRQKAYDAARASFDELAQKQPPGPLRADAAFMKAECLFRAEKYTEALPAYQEAQAAPPRAPATRSLALLHGGQAAVQVQKWDAALQLLQQIPRQFPDSPLLPEAYYELGAARQGLGQVDEALQAYEEAARLSRAAVGARARFMIGEIYFERKDHPAAIRQFLRVILGYGGEQAVDEVKPWQAKAGFEAGRCAEVQIPQAQPGERSRLLAEAKKHYQYVVDRHPQDELSPKAQQRLAVLSKL